MPPNKVQSMRKCKPRSTAAWHISNRNKNPTAAGRWSYSRAGRPDLSNAQIAIEALENAGMKKDDPAFQNALKFITRNQNNSETNDQKFAGNDGGFVYSPANDGESPAGVLIGADGKRVVRSYGSMTYAGLKSMIYAGPSKDDPRAKTAWDWISKTYT